MRQRGQSSSVPVSAPLLIPLLSKSRICGYKLRNLPGSSVFSVFAPAPLLKHTVLLSVSRHENNVLNALTEALISKSGIKSLFTLQKTDY